MCNYVAYNRFYKRCFLHLLLLKKTTDFIVIPVVIHKNSLPRTSHYTQIQ